MIIYKLITHGFLPLTLLSNSASLSSLEMDNPFYLISLYFNDCASLYSTCIFSFIIL